MSRTGSRGDETRGTTELTKCVATSSNSSDHGCSTPSQPVTPSTLAPTGYAATSTSNVPANINTCATPSGHTATAYRHYHEHSDSNDWDVRKWNEDRERDRETWIHDPEWLRVESWLDEHPDFYLDYFLRYVLVGLRVRERL